MQERLQEDGASCGEQEGSSPILSWVRVAVGCSALAGDRGESQVHRSGPRTGSSRTQHRGAAERSGPEYCPVSLREQSEAGCWLGGSPRLDTRSADEWRTSSSCCSYPLFPHGGSSPHTFKLLSCGLAKAPDHRDSQGPL